MKKIAIFTLQGIVNYGNRLQNYAVEQIVKQYGFEPCSINLSYFPWLKPTETRVRLEIDSLLGLWRSKKEAKREKKFLAFNNKYLNIKYVNVKALDTLDEEYEWMLTGSDQVWNPEFDPTGIFLLPFSNKRICLSPSIGTTDLSDDALGKLKQGLAGFKDISIREHAGKLILEKVMGREVHRLIDPTMFLTSDDWIQVENKPIANVDENNYIFSYVLGQNDIEKSDFAKKLEEIYHCKFCSIYDNKRENTIIAGPREFIWLIRHAKMIVTDSYHAVVFSLLFHKPFLVYKRKDDYKDMNSRFETLERVFGLENMYIDESTDFTNVSYNYERVEGILRQERMKFREYLDLIL